ncbi:MAG TPA: 23S rRNA (adenine(1618)-N(6))-methyltransferase RlmF [Bacteroidia bacterium]|jgi:23S rRNA (adenine1618-N6)-methyltransferase
MSKEEKKKTLEKEDLHPRNKHRLRYDFKKLIGCCPELEAFVFINNYHNETIDFADPVAVKILNQALLKQFYAIKYWDIPNGYLCPAIPGRADYIHYIADLLASSNNKVIPEGPSIRCLDIGTGANCVYPLIGNHEYGWSFVGSDCDATAIQSAKNNIERNHLTEAITLRHQTDSQKIFKGIIQANEQFDVSICNPPFHASLAEAREGTARKVRNLNAGKKTPAVLNFGGQHAELWCKGGEETFLANMIKESAQLPDKCFWFTSLVSKSANLPGIYYQLEKVNVVELKTIEMKQGNKISRLVAWTFLTTAQQKEWSKRWAK